MPNVGFLAHVAQLKAELIAPGLTAARAAEIGRLIWNDRIDAVVTAFFIAVVLIILADSIRVWTKLILGPRIGARDTAEAAA
jgi:carbon starvation protein